MRRYLHGLAERLGYTVAELSQRMTMRELIDWVACDQLAERDRRRNADGSAKPLIGD